MDMATARSRAESLMTSQMTFFTSGEAVTDPNTGEVSRSQDVVWFGKVRIRPATATQSREVDVGGAELFAYDYVVAAPFEATDLIEHLRGTVTESPDPALVGITMEVQRVARGDNITARRLACTVVA